VFEVDYGKKCLLYVKARWALFRYGEKSNDLFQNELKID
jgi:hypothetical protein